MSNNLLKETLKKNKGFIIDFSSTNSFEEMYAVCIKYIKNYSKEQLQKDINNITHPREKLQDEQLDLISGGKQNSNVTATDILKIVGLQQL